MRFSVLQSAANDGNQRVPLTPPLFPTPSHHLIPPPPPSHFLPPINLETCFLKGQCHETDVYFWRLTLLKMLLMIWSPSSAGDPAMSPIKLFLECFCLRKIWSSWPGILLPYEGFPRGRFQEIQNSRKNLIRDILDSRLGRRITQ